MNPLVERLYRAMPPFAQSAAATARGYVLRHWRYGPESERLVEEALERETWGRERWRAWVEQRLARVLHRAATRVPYYRAHWEERRRRGDRSSWEDLAHWPVLSKETLRRHNAEFLADDCEPRRMYVDRTSGTTGTPLVNYVSRANVTGWYALMEARLRRWHGVSRRDRWAMLSGQVVVPIQRTSPPFWVRNAGLNQLYLSCYHLSARTAELYAAELVRWAPTHMIVYPSSMSVLAAAVLDAGLLMPDLRVVLTNAEGLSREQRDLIEAACRCKARETYGMCEMVAAGSECGHDRLHLWPEAGFWEVLADDADAAVEPGEGGRLVATSLLNADMPFIRYDVGDRVRLLPGESCGCGRTLPVIGAIEGRVSDLIRTPDGRRIFSPPIYAGLPVRAGQIVQTSEDRLVVRVVEAPGFGDDATAALVRRLQDRTGAGMTIEVEAVAEIPIGRNGKRRTVVSMIDGAARNPPPAAAP